MNGGEAVLGEGIFRVGGVDLLSITYFPKT